VCGGLAGGLAGVVGPGDGEHDGYHEGQFRVGAVAVVEVDDGVEGPGSGADGPYPCSATHQLSLDLLRRVKSREDALGGAYSAFYAPMDCFCGGFLDDVRRVCVGSTGGGR